MHFLNIMVNSEKLILHCPFYTVYVVFQGEPGYDGAPGLKVGDWKDRANIEPDLEPESDLSRILCASKNFF